MNKFFASVAATVCAAAIVANATLLFRFNERLARIEMQLQIMSVENRHQASNK